MSITRHSYATHSSESEIKAANGKVRGKWLTWRIAVYQCLDAILTKACSGLDGKISSLELAVAEGVSVRFGVV